jgi:hypothetical protein
MQSLPTLSLLARWSTNWSDRLPAALLLLMALCASTAQAACVRDEPGRLWNYIGTLAGKHPVRMVLVFSGTQVQGVYTYASSLRDLRVAGTLADASRLTLQEQDAKGTITGRFDVTFPERDPGNTYGDSALTCDVIAGQWRKADTNGQPIGEPLSVYLRTEGATSGGLGKRYGGIGVRDDEVVNAGAARSMTQCLRRPIGMHCWRTFRGICLSGIRVQCWPTAPRGLVPTAKSSPSTTDRVYV